jgi:hypothetical protein
MIGTRKKANARRQPGERVNKLTDGRRLPVSPQSVNATAGRARAPMPLSKRVAFSPAEFAALCGRSFTWAYRQICAGRIKPIADCGRLLIPRSEIEAFLARKAEYNPVAAGGVGQ